ncbi:MAG: Ger(x)C family spore germination protein [Neobacillus sp.]|nr:Ger(x)C family spore germination protein [Neobacillus sp.]
MLLFLSFVCLLTLFGCTRTRTIDKLSIVHVFGFDMDEKKQLIGTALYPDYTKSKSRDEVQVLREKAPVASLFYQRMNKLTNKPVKLSKIRVLVLGKDFAEQGIEAIVGRFINTPELGTNIQVAISEQSAEETLIAFSKEKSLTMIDMLRHNMVTQNLPEMNLHTFLNHFYGQGMDAYVPMISIGQEDKIKVNGIGIFKDDKFKLQLNEEQTFLFSVLKESHNEGTLKIEVEDRGRKGLLIVRGYDNKQRWKLFKNRQGEQELKLALDLEWTVYQYPDWFDLKKEEDKQLMKKHINTGVKKKVEEFLATLKENEVDPIGIGNIVRSRIKTGINDLFMKNILLFQFR